MMRRAPAFTVAAVLTLAIAIAVNTAVFSVADAVLLRPLPYPDPHLVALVTRGPAGGPAEDSSQDGWTWLAVRDGAPVVDRAVFSTWTTGVNMVSGDGRARAARHVQQQRVGAGFFRVLGVPPLVGREFTPDEDRRGGPAVAILSAALWRSTFNSDPSVVGRAITLRGEQYEIVGVMPDGFESGQRADVWTPLRPGTEGEGGGENYHIVVRVRSDADWQRATAEIAAAGAAAVRARPGEQRPMTYSLEPLQAAVTRDLRRPLLILWAAVAIVLVVACVNLAGLLLARASGRTRELATRIALGSGRAGVVRQLIVESFVLAAAGGVAGVLLGYVALDALKSLARGAFEIWQPVAINGRAVGVAAALSLVSSIIFGLAPAVHASRLDPQATLSPGGRSVTGSRTRWPRRVLVVAQVALGIVLLVGAGLLVRTFAHLRGLEPGFSADGLVAASLSLEDARYRTTERISRLFEDTIEGVRRAPGVQSAAVSLGLPYERVLNLGFRHLEPAIEPPNGITSATYIAGDYFSTLEVPVRRGRIFDMRDTSGSPGVVIVNEAFATTYFKDRDPLGRSIAFAGREREIVGVVGNVQLRPGWGDHGPIAAMPLAYIPVSQVSDGMARLVHGWFAPALIVRALPSARLTADLRRAVDAVDPLLPFASVRSLAEVQAASLAPQRFLMALLVALASAAVLLAIVGIHGLIATSVAERRREMGIRLALGATAARAVRTLALPGVVLALVGVAIGIVASAGAVRLLRHFVWGVSTTDPLTFAGVAVLFVVVATIASLAPALRLLRLDPAVTLRQE